MSWYCVTVFQENSFYMRFLQSYYYCYSPSFPAFCHLSLLNELYNVFYLILSVCTTGMSGVLNYRPPRGGIAARETARRRSKLTSRRTPRGYLVGPTSTFRITYGIMRLQVCSINSPYSPRALEDPTLACRCH